MTFSLDSLPMLMSILPALTLLMLFTPAREKQLALMLCGLSFVWLTGGTAALALLIGSVMAAWLTIRLMPVKSSTANAVTYFGIALQIGVLALGKFLLPAAQLIPQLICVMQNIECISARGRNQITVPGLAPYLCYSAELPRLLAGPPMQYEASDVLIRQRKMTAEKFGIGAANAIFGVFQMVCLAIPMRHFSQLLKETVSAQTALDSWLMLIVFYFHIYFWIKGAAEIGQGIAQMLGLDYPDCFNAPILAGTQYGFWMRFHAPFSAWAKRVLVTEKSADAGSYFVRSSVTLGGIGLLLGKSWCGLIWGILCALILTGEHQLNPRWVAQIPITARRIFHAWLLLLGLSILQSDSVPDIFQFYGCLFAKNGFMLSSTALYWLKNYWVVMIGCMVGLFPLRKSFVKFAEKKLWRQIIAQPAVICIEIMMMLMSIATLVSEYLRG